MRRFYRALSRNRSLVEGISALAVIVALLATACAPAQQSIQSEQKAPTAAPAAPAAAAPQSGGTLRVVQPIAPITLDPMIDPGTPGIHIVDQLYDGLMKIAEDDSIVPGLAEKWTISPDQKVWSFELRKGVKFHNGDSFTADDVVYTVGRMMDPKGPATFKQMYIDALAKVEKVDDFKVNIHLKKPWPAFPVYLAANHLKILNKRAVEASGDKFGFTTVVGTGPFKFESWEKDRQVVIVKNPDYWQKGIPYLDKIIYRLIPDAQVAKLSIMTGEVDVLQDPPLDQLAELGQQPNIQVLKNSGAASMIINVNAAIPPFNDKRVRQAVSMAIDRQEIAKFAFFGTAEPANDLFPGWFWADDPNFKLPFDPQQAKKLLTDAGYSDAKPLQFTLLVYNFAPYTDMGQLIQAQLAKIGVKVEVRALTSATVLGFIQKQDQRPQMQAALFRHTARTDTWEFTGNRYSDVGGKLNYQNYNKPGGIQNPRAQELLNKLTPLADYDEKDRATAKPILAELNRIIMIEDLPEIVLVHQDNADVLRSNVQNWPKVSKDSSASYMKVWLSK